MRRVDFYFHNGCLSQPSLLRLAEDIETVYPSWVVAVHPLSDDKVKSLGFQFLPTVAINGAPIRSGMPSKEWLLEAIRMCEQ